MNVERVKEKPEGRMEIGMKKTGRVETPWI